jgi:hypothetical protein
MSIPVRLPGRFSNTAKHQNMSDLVVKTSEVAQQHVEKCISFANALHKI